MHPPSWGHGCCGAQGSATLGQAGQGRAGLVSGLPSLPWCRLPHAHLEKRILLRVQENAFVHGNACVCAHAGTFPCEEVLCVNASQSEICPSHSACAGNYCLGAGCAPAPLLQEGNQLLPSPGWEHLTAFVLVLL